MTTFFLTPPVYIGIILAIFHVAGTVEVSIDKLRIWHKELEIYSLQSLTFPVVVHLLL